MATISLIDNRALDDAATSNSTSTVGEPSVGTAGGAVFVTGNWYASRSTDGGANWTFVNPFTTLPSAAGGFCCDQVVVHDHRRGVWIWILQYIQQNGANVFRLAATHDADFPGGWYWWDIAPTTVNAGWTGVWFDYPDAAVTADNVFVTFNVFNAAGQWQRAVTMRFPLQTIADRGTLGFGAWSTTNNGSLRLTQGAGQTMYWGSHISGTQLRLFAWPDGQNAVSSWDIAVAQWSGAISSNAPNGVNWLGRTDPRITGAAVGNGAITFMWTAGSSGNRPHSHIRVVRINEGTKQVIDQPDIWSAERAWAYPATSTNSGGVLGLTAFYGGVDRNIGHIVGVRDDAAGTWNTAYSRLGTHSPDVPKWGDYLTCRADAPRSDTWVAAGYTLEGGQARTDILPRIVRFASEPHPPRFVIGNFGYDAGGWRVEQHPRLVADVSGDRRADIVGFGNAGAYVSRSNGDGTYAPLQLGVANFGYNAGGWRVDQHPRLVADVTGDRRADIVGFGGAGAYVSVSNGDGTFANPQLGVGNFGYNAGGWRLERHPRVLADTTGNGRADVVGFGDAGAYVSVSNGDGTFRPPQLGVANFGYDAGGWRIEAHPRALADVTGDGRADIVGFGNAGAWVSLSNGDGTFGQPQLGVANFGHDAGGWRVEAHPRFLADVTGAGRADIVGFGNGGVWVSLSNGDGTFRDPVLGVDNFGYDAGGWRVESHPRFLADTTGDGRADVVGFGNGGVWVSRSNGDGTFAAPELVVFNFGYDAGGWRIDRHPRYVADTNGDGRGDIVGFGGAGVWVSEL
jgi:hypothetical protein